MAFSDWLCPFWRVAPDRRCHRSGLSIAKDTDKGVKVTKQPIEKPTAQHQHGSLTDNPLEHAGHSMPAMPPSHGDHAGHTDHSGHETIFRKRFWLCLVLTLPVLLYSHMLQMWLGFTMPAFPGSQWFAPLFAILIFVIGGIPFLQMAKPELRNRQPGMMLLISLAITVAFVYSLIMTWVDPASGFFWEMALLIDVMLLGHWLEMRSVRQASGALNELAKLLPDEAERINADGSVEWVASSELRMGDLVLVRPGAACPPMAKWWRGVLPSTKP